MDLTNKIEDLKKQPLFSYNEMERRFKNMNHRIEVPLLVKDRFLEYFENCLKYSDEELETNEITYYAFGSDIVTMIQKDSSVKNIIKFCRNDGGFSIFKSTEGKTHSEDLLQAFSGWSDYTTISK